MRDKIRQIARRFLPDSIRKPLGTLAGKFDEAVIQRIQGLIFDLGGGIYKTDGCCFLIPKDQTTLAYRSVFLSGLYEHEEIELVRDFIRPDDRVIELGACIGVTSCIANKLLKDKARHLVVEANPFCIAALYQNRRLNDADFLIENCAVSAQHHVTFYLHPSIVMGGTAQPEKSSPVCLPAKSFAELNARYGPFTALIMDIEGAELEVLESAREILRHYRLVIFELHDSAIGQEGVERCRAILTEAGLKIRRRKTTSEAWQRD
jgi:FkbM family methyltransferase